MTNLAKNNLFFVETIKAESPLVPTNRQISSFFWNSVIDKVLEGIDQITVTACFSYGFIESKFIYDISVSGFDLPMVKIKSNYDKNQHLKLKSCKLILSDEVHKYRTPITDGSIEFAKSKSLNMDEYFTHEGKEYSHKINLHHFLKGEVELVFE